MIEQLDSRLGVWVLVQQRGWQTWCKIDSSYLVQDIDTIKRVRRRMGEPVIAVVRLKSPQKGPEMKSIDIVARLREVFQQRRYGSCPPDYDPDFDLFDAAADEIERLRATIAQLNRPA